MNSYTAQEIYDFEHSELRILQKSRSSLKATVFLAKFGSQVFAVKDFSQSNWILRCTLCRFLLYRECKALERIQGVDGVPMYYGRYGRYGFVMQAIPGEHPRTETFRKSPSLANQLGVLVANLHARGFTHNDLRRRNIIINHEGKLHVIDFAATFSIRGYFPSMLGLRPLLFGILKLMDQTKVIRVKRLYQHYQLNADEKNKLRRAQQIHVITDIWKGLFCSVRDKKLGP